MGQHYPRLNDSPRILLTGASGYVGGRLRPLLEEGGWRVRCLARRPEFLLARVKEGTEVVQGDVLDRPSLDAALLGVHTAYYLVHSMAAQNFAEADRSAARNFGEAAKRAGVRRVVYLGGLGAPGTQLSPHLRSRQEVGEVLRSTGVQVIEFRASIILGSGSLSFEMIRALVERLPVLITPRWVTVPAQPLAINDLLQYLLRALTLDTNENRTFEIGGPDQVSYGGLMREYARQRGLRRWFVQVPVLTPRLSSWWLGLVTPVYARVGRKLIDSIRNPTIVRDPAAAQVFGIKPLTVREAIASALRNEDQEFAATRWSDALSACGGQPGWGGVRFGNRIIDSRTLEVPQPPEVAFGPIQRIGGSTGWYYGDWLWRVRGWLDLLAGGAGMRRGRRHPEQLSVGDVVDCWRVEALEPNRRLRLQAEMKLPGRAWLEFDVTPKEGGAGSVIRQTAIFDPVGLSGIAYWYALFALHQLVFAGMLRGIAGATDRAAAEMRRRLSAETAAQETRDR